ncbi:MAG: hypothetical protein HOD58_09930 [Gammaproteobacteria bacterium]|jgi:hypothetical protein|nr:hypothetical protein [Gammaproteobacteria bacterium]MBT4330232.1 hypothetical protein [Gammaproteobacteria bacterium]MBT7023690.1 hypothetical protein [Gammaproteobacteria bacterium]MBT8008283.1 hypothetical protein [Gammaproteobacteria bacterium]
MIETVSHSTHYSNATAQGGGASVERDQVQQGAASAAAVKSDLVGGGDTEHFTQSLEAAAVIQQMKQRDQEVRTHEQAHLAAGGSYVQGSASYTYQQGPDGQRYAVGGEVGIDTAAVAGDPQATIQKAETVMRAALAPSEPSAQDMAVASAAGQMITTARIEFSRMQQEEGGEPEGKKVSSQQPIASIHHNRDQEEGVVVLQPEVGAYREFSRPNGDRVSTQEAVSLFT